MMRIQGHLTPNPGTRSSRPTPEEVWADAAAQGNGKQASSSKCCLAMVISLVGFIFLLGIGIVFYWHISKEETRDLELEKSRKKTSRQGQKEFLEKMNQWDSARDGDQVHKHKLKDKSTKMKFKGWFDGKKEKGSQDSSEEKKGPPEKFKYEKKKWWKVWKKQKLTKEEQYELDKENEAKELAKEEKKKAKKAKKAAKKKKKEEKAAAKAAAKKNKSRRRAAEVLELGGRRRLGGIHPTMARLQREIQEAQEAHDRKTRSEARELRRRLAENSSRGPPLNGIAYRRRRMASVRGNKVTGTRRRLAISPLMARLQREIQKAQEEHDRKQSNEHDL